MKVSEAISKALDFAHHAKMCGWPEDVYEPVNIVCNALIECAKDRQQLMEIVRRQIKTADGGFMVGESGPEIVVSNQETIKPAADGPADGVPDA